jgi:hypothetical protein
MMVSCKTTLMTASWRGPWESFLIEEKSIKLTVDFAENQPALTKYAREAQDFFKKCTVSEIL